MKMLIGVAGGLCGSWAIGAFFMMSYLAPAQISSVEEKLTGRNHSAMYFAGNAVTLQLTQSDTLRFVAQDAVQIQVRVLDNKGVAYASRVLVTTVEDCLLEEVIT